MHVVTDFLLEQPVTVPEERSIDDALREMIRGGVRALLVMRGEVVTGLITSYDIQVERPCSSSLDPATACVIEIEVGHDHDPVDCECCRTRLAGARPRAGLGSGRVFQGNGRNPRRGERIRGPGRGRSARTYLADAALERQLGHSI